MKHWAALLFGILPLAGGAAPLDAAVSKSYFANWRGQPYYCPNGNCLAHGRRDIAQADRASFRPVSEMYALDRHRVYYEGREVHGADPRTWTVQGRWHGRDHQHLYIRRFRIDEVDAGSARYLPRHYVLDERHVYYGEFDQAPPHVHRLEGAQPGAFRFVLDGVDTLARDDRSLYAGAVRLPLALAPDFQPLWRGAGFALVFMNQGELHTLGGSRTPGPDALARRLGAVTLAEGIVRYPGATRYEGNSLWGLVNRRHLVVPHEGELRVVRDGVKEIRLLEQGAFHVVADGRLLFRPPKGGDLVDLGSAEGDLQLLDMWTVRNGGRTYRHGQPVGAPDAPRSPAH